jgi:hypothetical protein
MVPYCQLDSGHALGHRQNSVLFDEQTVYAQCRRCNQGGDGEKMSFMCYLINKHGRDWYEMKLQGSKQSVFYSDLDFRAIAKEYREKYNALKRSIS